MNLDELHELAESTRANLEKHEYEINVCMSVGCLSQHSDQVKNALGEAVTHSAEDCGKNTYVRRVGCMGRCSVGPLVEVVHTRMGGGAETPKNILYNHVKLTDAAAIVQSLGGGPAGTLQCSLRDESDAQLRIVLENSGRIDPEKIEEYIARGGYEGLVRAITEFDPPRVVAEIMASGLRGRGGGGYPTGLKWSTVAKTVSQTKFVICNGDEGDPGAFMDRSVLESDPQRVVEGMTIAAYAVGASRGYMYVRAEYPLAVSRLNAAIRDARRKGFLGNNICNSSFSFDIEIRLGAGAFVCGEETALIASIEGKRGTPKPRPPYPAVNGLWSSPTLINNVETFANVPAIMRNGSDWFARIGTGKSKGTKVFALTGKIRNTGLVEVPMGTPLRTIVEVIGGGVPDGRIFKAVQTGGPSGGCIPADLLDLQVSYESLIEVGSMMGSGGMIVMDDTSCMVNVARFFVEFCMTESCGKCIPCRAGTAQMYRLLTRICEGEATMADLDLLIDLCATVKEASLCGLGQTAPSPVLSTLRYFRHEYLEHIEQKRCSAGVCVMKQSPVNSLEVIA